MTTSFPYAPGVCDLGQKEGNRLLQSREVGSTLPADEEAPFHADAIIDRQKRQIKLRQVVPIQQRTWTSDHPDDRTIAVGAQHAVPLARIDTSAAESITRLHQFM
jgi:hypothetical protein